MKNTLILAALLIIVLAGGYYMAATQAATTPARPGGSTASSTATAAGSYTAADVAQHATASDCWASISGNVYDLSSWVSQHPGGEAPILTLCGKDGTSAFLSQHGNDGRAQETLATFKVGTLAP